MSNESKNDTIIEKIKLFLNNEDIMPNHVLNSIVIQEKKELLENLIEKYCTIEDQENPGSLILDFEKNTTTRRYQSR